MLQDRPYMRDSYEKRDTSPLTWLVSLIISAFLVQSALMLLPRMAPGLDFSLGVTPDGLRSGHLWTLVTYGFMQDAGSLAGNLLLVIAYVVAIYVVGRAVVPIMGARRFMGFYAAALVAGGLLWTAVHWNRGGILLGASSAVWALVVLYACFYPNREMTLVMFFVLPVTVRPKYVAYVLLAVDLCGFVFYEILGAASPLGGTAHSAHLGGMAAAWIYFRYVHDAPLGASDGRKAVELPRWLKQAEIPKLPAPRSTGASRADPGHLRAEVDRILDKINSEGLGSLSVEERKVLDEARDLIGRR